jgi:DNA-directed RNA polymerase specialized sigma24 family protein
MLKEVSREQLAEWIRVGAGRDNAAEKALTKLAVTYNRRVMRYCIGQWRLDQADAEEVWSDVFMELHRTGASYKALIHPSAWVLAIARDVAVEHIRKRNALKRGGPGTRPAADPERANEVKPLDVRQLAMLSADAIESEPELSGRETPADPGPVCPLDLDELPAPRPWREAFEDCVRNALKAFGLKNPRVADALLMQIEEDLDGQSLAHLLGKSHDAARKMLSRAHVVIGPFMRDCLELLMRGG